ncbi:MAG: hypothetical protein Q4G43_02190, partial [Mobilicoccus sp.]|nr:hypothetical protein [Mobilicoccus sp.]
GEAKRLTVDDSWAEERVAMGVDRAEAESGPGAHTITRWIGIDAPDHTPRTTSLEVETPGWLILCSDGLWNYASEADALAAVVRDIARQGADREQADGAASESSAASEGSAALVLSRDLVTWANAQGGHDNITVVAARLPGEKEGTDG